MDRPDEVSYSDYRRACDELQRHAAALRDAAPDEAAEHWLPGATRELALIFSFVGSNMTARHVPHYLKTVAVYQAIKDVTPTSIGGTMPSDGPPTTGGSPDGNARHDDDAARHDDDAE
jgi:hypothetical protein